MPKEYGSTTLGQSPPSYESARIKLTRSWGSKFEEQKMYLCYHETNDPLFHETA
jgi:hypothetical protein